MKKNTSIWIDPHVLKELKLLGVEHDKPIGDVIAALVRLAKSDRYINDETFQSRFQALRDSAFLNASTETGDQVSKNAE